MSTNETTNETTLPSLDMERAKPLKDWILSERTRARCVWQMPATKKNPRALEGWIVNGHLVILMISSYGWEIFTQSQSNDVAQTLAEVEAHCGLNQPAFPIPTPIRVQVRVIDKDHTAPIPGSPVVENGWLYGYTANELACVLIDGETNVRTFHQSKISAMPVAP